jgi:hypothetical protein
VAPLRLALWPAARAVHRAVGEAANPTDRTVIELQQARRRDQHRRDRETDAERRRQERDRAREEKQARATTARQAELRVRDEKLAADREQKDARRAERTRDWARRDRMKWRAGLVQRLKRHVGWGPPA